jgi:ribose transport system ATP-binding protein
MTGSACSVRGVTKRFPGVVALDDVSIDIREHEVVGLVGQNGSGKSTLLKILAGLHRADAGTVELRGRPVSFPGPAAARAAGVGMVFQEQSLMPSLSVAENIMLGMEGSAARGGVLRWRRLRRAAAEELAKLGSAIDPRARTESLSQGERQMVELAKALATGRATPDEPLLLFDEATSVLARDEIAVMLDQIDRLRERAAVVFVSHRLDEVLRVADRVYVLKDGVCVAERERGRYDEDELFRLMVGSELSEDYFRVGEQKRPGSGTPRLELTDLAVPGVFQGFNAAVQPGEILGLCGVEGSGRREVLRAVFGAAPVSHGRILLDGRGLRLRSPAAAVGAGIGYVPAERTSEAALMELSVAQNVTLSHLGAARSGPILSARTESAAAQTWIERLGIRVADSSAMMRTLSGGNQQKVVFARWMLSPDLRVLLLDHPTRGLDAAAKRDVYGLVRELSARGVGILLMSDSLEETIGLAHRLVVMRDGEITAELPAAPTRKPSPVDIVEHMV